MKYKRKSSFVKDLKKIKDKKLAQSIVNSVQNIESAKNIYKIQGVLKLK